MNAQLLRAALVSGGLIALLVVVALAQPAPAAPIF
jgi:hypothetical protein